MKFFNHIPSEEELELRIKCAIMYTDISILSMCILSFLYDLQDALESENRLRHENKRFVNRAMNLAVQVTSHLQDEFKEEGKGCLKSYYQLYDELQMTLAANVLLLGTERYLSLIDTLCDMIAAKLNFLKKHHHTFDEVKDLETIPTIKQILKDISCERTDLESIIRPVLSRMLTKEEIEIAKDHYREAIVQYQKLKN